MKQHGLNCRFVGLPIPTGNASEDEGYNIKEEFLDGSDRVSKLNHMQLKAYNKIMEAVEDDNTNGK
ncbi:hypothetical protein BB559_007491, partial [Furculomyces boomerangus]